MVSALLLIFSPDATWQRICRKERGVVVLLLTYLLPLFILLAAAEGFSLVQFGRVQVLSGKSLFLGQDYSGKTRYFTRNEAVVFETGQFFLMLGLVILSTQMVRSVARNFRGRPSFIQGFTTVAYGLSPLFFMRFLQALPLASPWMSWVIWAIGILWSAAVLYHGVPQALQPEPSQAFGVYLITTIFIVFLTALLRFVVSGYLHGAFPKVEPAVSYLAGLLPF